MLVDACRRGGARRITVVIPYFGYARQDRRRATGEPVAARVVADLIGAVRADRVLVVDPHTPGLEALFGIPVEAVSAAPLLASGLTPLLPLDAVVVAPDLGAVKLAERYAALLRRPTVIVRKRRLSGSTVRVEEVVGDVAGRTPVVVDDMITTGALSVQQMQAGTWLRCPSTAVIGSSAGCSWDQPDSAPPRAAGRTSRGHRQFAVGRGLPVADRHREHRSTTRGCHQATSRRQAARRSRALRVSSPAALRLGRTHTSTCVDVESGK